MSVAVIAFRLSPKFLWFFVRLLARETTALHDYGPISFRVGPRLVDKSLNVCCGDSVPTLPEIPVVFVRLLARETTAFHDYGPI